MERHREILSIVPKTSSKYVNAPEPAAITRKPIFSSGRSAPLMIYTHPHAHIATPDAVSGPWPHNPCTEYITFFPVCVQRVFLRISSYHVHVCAPREFQNAALGYKYFLFCLEIACNTSTWVTYFRETRRSRPGRECGISQVKKAPREPTLRVE